MNITKDILKGILPARRRRRLYLFFSDIAPDNVKAQHGQLSMFWSIRNLRDQGFAPKTVIDIGAYRGDWTRSVIEIFPDAEYYMIEAQPAKKAVLEDVKKVSRGNVEFEVTLLGAENKESVRFFTMETGSSVLEEQTNYPRQVIDLPMKTLDDVVIKKGLQGEFFLKLDVQGYELEVLKGAPKTIENTNFVLLEVSLLNYNKDAPLFADVVEFMSKRDFSVYDICETHRKSSDNVLNQVDLIFAKKGCELRKRANIFV